MMSLFKDNRSNLFLFLIAFLYIPQIICNVLLKAICNVSKILRIAMQNTLTWMLLTTNAPQLPQEPKLCLSMEVSFRYILNAL